MPELADSAKEKLAEILAHVASQERTVVEFEQVDGTLYASDITNHVDELEAIVNE